MRRVAVKLDISILYFLHFLKSQLIQSIFCLRKSGIGSTLTSVSGPDSLIPNRDPTFYAEKQVRIRIQILDG